jgi:exopolysaccharide biosynthesis operon protein EpsL
MRRHTHAGWLLAGLLAGVASLPAQAEDGLTVTGGLAISHDDNLYRLRDGVDPQTVLGHADGGETITISSLGLSYSKPFGLQRLEASLGVVNYDYQRYPQLDLLARNHDASWFWSLTPRLHGRLHSERRETVNSFDNASAPDQGNARLRRHEAFDATYEIDGVWRALGNLRSTLDSSEQAQLGEDSYRARTVEGGLRYEALSGSSATAWLRRSNGKRLGENSTSVDRDENYTQQEQSLDLQWALGGKTRAGLVLTHLSREHPAVPSRDYSVSEAAVNLNWVPTGKLQASLRWSSQLASYQTANASYSRTQQLGATLAWQLAARTSLQAGLSESRRRYLGAPEGQPADPLRDRTREASLELRWAATRNLSLDSSVQEVRRSANLPGYAYRSRQWQLGLNAAF